jgi:hypothetical protein
MARNARFDPFVSVSAILRMIWAVRRAARARSRAEGYDSASSDVAGALFMVLSRPAPVPDASATLRNRLIGNQLTRFTT